MEYMLARLIIAYERIYNITTNSYITGGDIISAIHFILNSLSSDYISLSTSSSKIEAPIVYLELLAHLVMYFYLRR